MGEENSTPRSAAESPKKMADGEGAHVRATSAAASGEMTVDIGGKGVGAEGAADARRSTGPYRFVRKLGEGGMGQVWLAEQMAPVKRLVALKLIKGGLYDSAMLQRFESERQSLAVMNHPVIAKVFDAGTTTDGQPYFVMEYVDGLAITKYCDSKRLNVRQRLELFIQVCEGVQHAHQKAIIHRDLKPSNVLVVEVDGKPVPRIIDFGLAKAISPQTAAEQTLFTQMGALVGTRGFMSPEQADPNVLDVDTRTDVYSLGVTLYMLLTGTLPFDPEQWKRKPVDEVLRQLRQQDPPSPSSKLSGEKQTAEDSAKKRATEQSQLVAMLRGDLDWITLKALEKDRARRYGTPSELAADLDRYLHDRPVVARPSSTGYRLRKYVQRHRVGVGVVAGAAALLVAFAVAQSVQLRRITVERDRATHERDRATRERDRANRITEFMTSMFNVSDPGQARGNSVTAREILDKASKDIDAGLAKDPELQSQLMSVMGMVYTRLGLYPQAQPLLERAVETRRGILGPESPETLASMLLLARLLYEEGQYAQAEKLYRETLDIQRRVLGPEHPETLLSMNQLAGVLDDDGQYDQAEKLHREALDIQRRVLGPEHQDTLKSMSSLANAVSNQLRYAEAEKLQRETIEIQRRVLGPDHPDTLRTMNNLAATLSDEGQNAEAEKLQRETIEIQRRVLGPDHPETLRSMNNLSDTLGNEGRNTEAEKLQRETIEIQRRVLGPDHLETLRSMENLAGTLFLEGHYTQAERLYRETLDIQRRVLGPNHPETASSVYNLACVAAHKGQREEALSLLREAVDHGLEPKNDLNIEKDPDLRSLHGDPRFALIVADAKERAAAAKKPN